MLLIYCVGPLHGLSNFNVVCMGSTQAPCLVCMYVLVHAQPCVVQFLTFHTTEAAVVAAMNDSALVSLSLPTTRIRIQYLQKNQPIIDRQKVYTAGCRVCICTWDRGIPSLVRLIVGNVANLHHAPISVLRVTVGVSGLENNQVSSSPPNVDRWEEQITERGGSGGSY